MCVQNKDVAPSQGTVDDANTVKAVQARNTIQWQNTVMTAAAE